MFTAAGFECGDLVWCLCPNGRTMQQQVGEDYPPLNYPSFRAPEVLPRFSDFTEREK
jgi:hypothetical protein